VVSGRGGGGLWFSIRVAYFSQVLDVFYVEICEKCVRHRCCNVFKASNSDCVIEAP
jgi:hypothetical protein